MELVASPFAVALLGAAAGLFVGYVLRNIVAQQKKNSVELKIKQLYLDAKSKAQETVDEAAKKAESLSRVSQKETKERELQLRRLEEHIVRKEELVEKRRVDVEKDAKTVEQKTVDLKKIRDQLERAREEQLKALEQIAQLSETEAKNRVFQMLEQKYETDLLARAQKLELFGKEELERKARDILSTIIQRLASSTTSEITTTSVPIPSDDVKGKIIGKEGRNIRALERAAGVEVIVDDTPGAVVISSFDPVRRHIARIALENLVLDGRIQPARIEETVERAKTEVEKIIKEAGEAAMYDVGVFDIDPRLLMLLGRLRFRTSYGQNVLQHSIEMAHLAGMLASELGADVQIAKKGALLHDIGKAVDHEIQGTHVEIGRRILQKFNVDERIIQAMQSHHEEYPYETLESIIVQTVDVISAGRPGARRDTVENYLKRLEDLERIANAFDAVEKSYAIQAGREIRIFVTPEKISDIEAKNLARTIADQVEAELKYPGEIKVHVIRETRVIEYAR